MGLTALGLAAVIVVVPVRVGVGAHRARGHHAGQRLERRDSPPTTLPGFSPPAVSADGRYIAFDSSASNLAANAPDGGVFVRDTSGGTTTSVSVKLNGTSDDAADTPAISGDGRYVAFVRQHRPGRRREPVTSPRYSCAIARPGRPRVSTKPNGNQATDESGIPVAEQRRPVHRVRVGFAGARARRHERLDRRVRPRPRRQHHPAGQSHLDGCRGGQWRREPVDQRRRVGTSRSRPSKGWLPADTDVFFDVYVRDLTANNHHARQRLEHRNPANDHLHSAHQRERSLRRVHLGRDEPRWHRGHEQRVRRVRARPRRRNDPTGEPERHGRAGPRDRHCTEHLGRRPVRELRVHRPPMRSPMTRTASPTRSSTTAAERRRSARAPTSSASSWRRAVPSRCWRRTART